MIGDKCPHKRAYKKKQSPLTSLRSQKNMKMVRLVRRQKNDSSDGEEAWLDKRMYVLISEPQNPRVNNRTPGDVKLRAAFGSLVSKDQRV